MTDLHCPNCSDGLEVVGSVTFGLHDGALWRCPSCNREFASADSDGKLIWIKPLPIPKVRMDDIKP